MAESTPKSYSTDPALFLYTSLTSGSSHIVTATSRLETILKANRIPFKALDIATDEKARMLWGRRSGKDESGRARKIPGLVQMGLVVGDLVEIEEWNEYGELKEHVTIYHEGGAPKSAKATPSSTPSKSPIAGKENKKPEPVVAEPSKDVDSAKSPTAAEPNTLTLAMRQVGQEAAQKAKDTKKKVAETFPGVGVSEPQPQPQNKEVENKDEHSPPSISIAQPPSPNRTIISPTVLQSPTSTAWKRAPDSLPTIEHSSKGQLQSPTSTTWKPTDLNPPIITHRGSSVSEASADCIKKVEDDAVIPEEDEDNLEEAVNN